MDMVEKQNDRFFSVSNLVGIAYWFIVYCWLRDLKSIA